MSLEREHTALYGKMRSGENARVIADPIQLRPSQAFGPESCHQEDHPFRSLHVLLAHPTRNEVVAILQSRKHHLHLGHPKTTELRDLHRGLPHPGQWIDVDA